MEGEKDPWAEVMVELVKNMKTNQDQMKLLCDSLGKVADTHQSRIEQLSSSLISTQEAISSLSHSLGRVIDCLTSQKVDLAILMGRK